MRSTDDEPDESANKRERYLLYGLLGLCAIPFLVMFAVKSFRDMILESLIASGHWIGHQGAIGWMAYVALYTGWVTVLLPQTCVELLAGWVFPLPLALLLAGVGRGLGTLSMCAIGRQLVRDMVSRHLLSRNQFLQALVAAIHRHPRKAAALIAVVEIPMSVKNYSWAVTDAPIILMVGAQVFCQLPYSIFTVYVGHSSESLLEVLKGGHRVGSVQIVFSVIGIIMGFVALAALAYFTKRELDRMVEEEQASCAASGDVETGFEQDISSSEDDEMAPLKRERLPIT